MKKKYLVDIKKIDKSGMKRNKGRAKDGKGEMEHQGEEGNGRGVGMK